MPVPESKGFVNLLAHYESGPAPRPKKTQKERVYVRTLTLEVLETSDGAIAVLWRTVRDNPYQNALQLQTLLGIPTGRNSQFHVQLKRLLAGGWVNATEGKRQERRYSVVDELPEAPGETTNDRFAAIRKQINQLMKKCHKARYSGLAKTMSRALQELEETDLPEVREKIYVKERR